MSSLQANHHTHNAIVPGAAQRQQQQPPQHDHTRPLPPPPPPTTAASPFATGQTTTASFRSVSRNPLPPPPPTSSSSLSSSLSSSSSSSSTATRISSNSGSTTPATTTTTTTTTTTSSGPNAAGEVSLEAPRPDGERLANEYVETPFRPNTQQQQQQQKEQPTTKKSQHSSAGKHCTATSKHHHHHHRRNGPVTKQPVSFTKEPSSQQQQQRQFALNGQQQQDLSSSLSIMCERCGKCRCESCREPPPLPSRWLCDNSCYCSAETVLDYASCLCCAKGLFYHCSLAGNDDATTSCADEPCSCVGPRRLARWSCLSALALVLPCLLCYWPLKGCVALCEAGYAKHASQGCRCEQPELGGEKRLLAPESS